MLALIMVFSLLAGCDNTKTTAETTEAVTTEAASTTDTAAQDTTAQQTAGATGDVDYNEAFTLRVATGGSNQVFEAAAKIYNEIYPNATLVNVESPWGNGGQDARNKQLIMLSSGETLDIGKVVWSKEFYLEGITMDLTDFVKSLDIYPNYTAGQLERIMLGDTITAITTNNNCDFLWYNKTLCDKLGVEVPTTIEELEAIGKKLTDAKLTTDSGLPVYLTTFENGNWCTDYWLWTLGGKQTNEDFTQCLINSSESIAAYEEMQSYILNGWAPKVDGTGDQAWLNGQVMFYVQGDWIAKSTNEAGLDYGCTVLPKGKDGTNCASIGGAEWVVFNQTKYPQQSLDFLKVLVSAEMHMAYPSVSDVSYYTNADKIALWDADGITLAKQTTGLQLASGTKYNFLEAPYAYPDAYTIYNEALQKILTGLMDPTEVMNEAQAEIQTGLDAFYANVGK